ncbi:KRUF family protein [Besnoitia besnoiti]|uniref:KRUF family protein n=1 Tax=Besnoitia besnoiti TaxID=94643 RepID=A0A2A9MJD9_BESBE|nr:KRUF family protein [Besnoitia besnoiti]PFH37304.1 KRUF family protein [Besnoitia besnoiti]
MDDETFAAVAIELVRREGSELRATWDHGVEHYVMQQVAEHQLRDNDPMPSLHTLKDWRLNSQKNFQRGVCSRLAKARQLEDKAQQIEETPVVEQGSMRNDDGSRSEHHEEAGERVRSRLGMH